MQITRKTREKQFSVCAPAKINMYLHITGRREDGLHLLDSLVMFADEGDKICLKQADSFCFSVQGPYGFSFNSSELDQDVHADNLVVKAARRLAEMLGKDLSVDITLTKNLPLSAGIGGGSSDAAATIKALLAVWGISPQDSTGFDDLLLALGADVPVCMAGVPSKMSGVGEKIEPLNVVEDIAVVLLHSGTPCPTAEVFARYEGEEGCFTKKELLSAVPAAGEGFIEFLKEQHNDLTQAAIGLAPEISMALKLLERQKGSCFSRMSGSGATCFGVFDNEKDALEAAAQISREKPDWWVRASMLNRVGRVTGTH